MTHGPALFRTEPPGVCAPVLGGIPDHDLSLPCEVLHRERAPVLMQRMTAGSDRNKLSLPDGLPQESSGHRAGDQHPDLPAQQPFCAA